MITADEARSKMPNKIDLSDDLCVIERAITQVATEGKDTLCVDVLFDRDRFRFFDEETEHLNPRGIALKQFLQGAGYHVILREERWNDGPDFIITWAKNTVLTTPSKGDLQLCPNCHDGWVEPGYNSCIECRYE